MAWLAQLGPHTGYADGLLGPLILAGFGLGMVIAPAINTGTYGVAPQDAGVASATVTVSQQLGASIGTSLLNTIFATAVASYLVTHESSTRFITRAALNNGLAHGYDVAFWDVRDHGRRGRHRRPPAAPAHSPVRRRRPRKEAPAVSRTQPIQRHPTGVGDTAEADPN
jgi:hypothetical protein